MSKRFGRNQKRRMREEIVLQAEVAASAQERAAQYAGALERDHALLKWHGKKLDDAKDFLESIASMVGREAIIAGEPTDFQWHEKIDRIRTFPRPAPSMSVNFGGGMTMDHIRYEVLRLLDVEAIRASMSRQMQVLVTLGDEEVYYAISEEALFELGEEELVQKFIRPMSIQLARKLKERWKR